MLFTGHATKAGGAKKYISGEILYGESKDKFLGKK